MITGELKSKVDRLWDAFWSGGISNPLEVIEQITYLLFIRRLDDLQTLAEGRARTTGRLENGVFGSDQQHLRWSRLKNDGPDEMFRVMGEQVFPFLRDLGGDGSTYSQHMRDARFTIPNAALLSRVVDMVDGIPMVDRDTNGDLYEYMLGKIATSGTNGQFRTPRHIIQLMVDLMAPTPADEIVDPACGTAGFLVAASEFIREHHESALLDEAQRGHFHRSMFHGYDFDRTMLRIGSMNMLMHGIESPDIRYQDSLSESADAGTFTLVLANPPFAGSVDAEGISKDLTRVAATKKTELLFLALILKLLKPGGRAAVIVPDGVLFGSSRAHKALRQQLVENQKLDAVIKLPAGAFRPYTGVSAAILCFTKTDSGGTESVWFYDVRADGFTLDDKRTPVGADDLPDVRARWARRVTDEMTRLRTDQSFHVPRDEIVERGFDLTFMRYRELPAIERAVADPLEIIAQLEQMNDELRAITKQLRADLS